MGTKARRERVGKEAEAFGLLLGEFGVLKRRGDMSEFDAYVYSEQLSDIPLALLEVGKDWWFAHGTGWYPTPPEWKQACESARKCIRASLKHEPCEECSSGWVSMKGESGRSYAIRCRCWEAYQDRVKALGMPNEPLALPAAMEEGE